MVRTIISMLDYLPAGVRRALVRWVLDLVWKHYVELEVSGVENIPDGPCLYICNHLSNADAVTLNRVLRPRKVFFMAGVKLTGTTLTRVVMDAMDTIPIRPNSPDVEALKHAVEMLKHGKSILIFPEGTRSRTAQLMRGKRGAGLIARRSGVPIVPVALAGTEKVLPINEQNMGGEQIHHAHVKVAVGRPFHVGELAYTVAEGEDERQALADAMMRRIAELLPQEYRGYYGEP